MSDPIVAARKRPKRVGPYKKAILAPVPLVREVCELLARSTWTDAEIETAAGVSRAYICQLRTGRRTDPSLTCITALLGVFGRKLKIVRGWGNDRHDVEATKTPRPVVSRPVLRKARKGPRKVAYAGAED